MPEPNIVILGAGPAGLGAAYRLRLESKAAVSVLEQGERVGGNAGSFEAAGQQLDFGSHRLHPACDPEVLGDIRALLGPDLLDRPRHGRIRLRGNWIRFPLKPVDMMRHTDPAFVAGTLRDTLIRSRGARGGAENFATVLERGLGPTICREFYFPYARKIWGLEPEELSAIQARRRVSAGSVAKLVRKVLAQVPGLRKPGAGRFFYPRRGFGQICEAYAEAAVSAGATLSLGSRVTALLRDASDRWTVRFQHEGGEATRTADHVWSTIPVSLLPRMVQPAPPAPVLEAAGAIDYRAMLLVYLTLERDRFTEFDAHYFPGAEIGITRLSEPKNYSVATEPRGRTTLCAELPCAFGDALWQESDEALAARVSADLAVAGIPLTARVAEVHVRRLRNAYPIYRTGYEAPLGILDDWVESLPNFLSYGRQGLFAHDNTHHALYMAYAAVACLSEGRFDTDRWKEYREVFATHVVED